MPVYTFRCEDCEENFEITCSISLYDQISKNCPLCKTENSVVRDYQEDNIYGNVKNYNTVGSYAERQTKKYGAEKAAILKESFKTKKEGEIVLPKGASIVDTSKIDNVKFGNLEKNRRAVKKKGKKNG